MIKKIITDSSYMFDRCAALLSFPDISPSITDSCYEKDYSIPPLFDEIENSNNLNNTKNIYFEMNKNLISTNLTSIKNNRVNNTLITSDIINILDKIPKINSLSSLINSNVTDVSFMFYYCSSLLSLPDISKWNTENVSNMCYLFGECKSIISLPDII